MEEAVDISDANNNFLMGMTLSPDGEPLLMTYQSLYFLNADGTVRNICSADGSVFSVCTDVLQDREGARIGTMETYTQEAFDTAWDLLTNANLMYYRDDTIPDIILEEADAFFAGDKTAEETASILQSRVSIYLAEQS